jgi:hypothetical protein
MLGMLPRSSPPPRSPFLKKRLMSRVFDGVDVRFVLPVGWGVLVSERARRGRRLRLKCQGVGGAVKAGPSGGRPEGEP